MAALDCDDLDADIYPGAQERCDGVDQDCDGEADQGLEFVSYIVDSDGDGYGAIDGETTSTCDGAPEGYAASGGDCDDTQGTIYPGAAEVCDGIDQSCDGEIDEGLDQVTYYEDADGDSHGAPDGQTRATCDGAPGGFAASSDDCNDSDPLIYPAAQERCDEADQDCDGLVDEGLEVGWYVDGDGDGVGTGEVELTQCAQPVGYASQSGDCDDEAAFVFPGASETCNSIDDNCDGVVDDGVLTAFHPDADGDGYGDTFTTVEACEAPEGFLTDAQDCYYACMLINPDGYERRDERDNDCDATVDEMPSCAPEDIEIADDTDNDCDGIVDEGVTSCFTLHRDEPELPTGRYTIDPDGPGPIDALEVFCDMDQDGGGWMLVTPAMIQTEVAVYTTPAVQTDAEGGLIHTAYGNSRGCGVAPQSSIMDLLSDDVFWRNIRFSMEFMGSNSCWAIFGNSKARHEDATDDANLMSFDAALDDIWDEHRMGGSAGDAFDGISQRCDNTTINFWHPNQGNGLRSASVLLRRDMCSPGAAGFSVGVSCTNYGSGTSSPTWWSHSDIFVR